MQKVHANPMAATPSRMNFSQDVLVSIVNWNGGATLERCLESLHVSAAEVPAILVIDNGSTDDSIRCALCRFPAVLLLQNKDNRGFAAGQNQALRFAQDHGFEFIWILNGDTVVPQGTLSVLLDGLCAESGIGAVSPQIVLDNDRGDTQFIGCQIHPRDYSFTQFTSESELRDAEATEPNTVMLWATALLARVSVLQKVGGFDEHFFAYFEDLDLSARLWSAGFRNVVIPEARVIHAGRNVGGDRPPYYTYYNVRNRYRFWMKYLATTRERVSFVRIFLAGALVNAAHWRERGDTARATATLAGIWDAVVGRAGIWKEARLPPRFLQAVGLLCPYLWADVLRLDFRAISKRLGGS